MDIESIRNKVNNYESCSIDDVEEILNFIAERKKQELEIDFEFEIVHDRGGFARITPDGLYQVEIGSEIITEMKFNKEFKRLRETGQIDIDTEIPEVLPIEERKEFIELILVTFHELRHIKQFDSIYDHPISNKETHKMTRERIINESFGGFINFNYEQSTQEIDAMKTSLEETVSFLKEMGTDITPDEVFAVMKEKELSFLDYDLQDFGDSYETAISYFNKIYGKPTDIKGISDIIEKLLSEEKKEILFGQCQELLDKYYAETDIDRKMDLLKEMSLHMTPELRERYPLLDDQIERDEETGIILNSVNGKTLDQIERNEETGIILNSVNGKTLDQLTVSYKNMGINQSDLQVAYTTMIRTKDEKEQTFSRIQTNRSIDDFGGR